MQSRFIPSAPYIGALGLLCALLRGNPAVAQAPAEAPPASDEKAACLAAFDAAQVDRAASKLVEARQQLLECSRPTCGDSLMVECTNMYAEVEKALPSLVLSARLSTGTVDLTEVEVLLDGRPFAGSLDGRPIPINPGAYQLTFKAQGYGPQERRVVVGTGDTYRQVSVVFPAAPVQQQPPQAAAPAAVAVTPSAPAEVPVMTYVLGGIGVAGLGTFAVLRIIADSDLDTLKSGCAPTCPDSDVSQLHQKYLFSQIAFGTGMAAAAGAVLWYVLDGDDRPSSEQSVAVGFEPMRGGALTTATTRF